MNPILTRLNAVLLSAIFLFLLAGCKKDGESAKPGSSLYNFSFLKKNNPGFTGDVHLTNYGPQIRGNLPYNIDIEKLVATFNHTGISVTVNNQEQLSGVTENDFTQPLNYTIKNQDGTSETFEIDAVWFTGLPMIFITTEGGEEINSVDEYVQGNATIAGGRSYKDSSGEMKIRGRGHSTWYFHPKKPFQLKFDDKTEVLGMPADKKWIFLAEHSDKTLIRNKLAFEMGHLSKLKWTPQNVYAEVFVNNAYNGTYNISQKVEDGEHRVDLNGTGYLIEIDVLDHIKPDDIYFNTSHFLIQIKEPELQSGSAKYNFIKDYVVEFEDVLFSENFNDPETGYKKYIDVESVVDWYLINEIAKNQDARDYSSIYLHLVPGEKLKMGPIWDFDLGFGNVNYSDCEYPTGYWVKYHAWINRMFEDPEFVLKVKERFVFFKNNEGHLLEFIDNSTTYLKLAQHENNEKWHVLGNWLWPNPVVFNTHQEEADYLKDWFSRRMKWLDDVYKSL